MTLDALSPAAVPAAASPPRRAVAPALAFAVLALAALVWSALVRLPLWRMDGLDDAFYVEVAHLWARGLPPYLYAYDVKPPGFFALLALAETALGPTLDALRALAVVCDAATAMALLMLGRRFGQPSVGVFAALSFPVLNELVTANDAYSPLGGADRLRLPRRLVAARPDAARADFRPADRRSRRRQADGRLRGAGDYLLCSPSRPRRRAGVCGSERSFSPARPSRRSPFSPISPPSAARAR